MKKLMDKFKKYFIVNKKIFFFLSILLIIGIISGTIFSIVITDTDSKSVTDYLANYLDSIKNNSINLFDSFFSSSLSSIMISIIIFLLGLSVIGIPIIFIIFFYKSFIFGFTIGSILINYKVKGILLSIIYMLPHHVINILVLIVFIIYAYIISLSLVKAFFKREEINFKAITYKYLIMFIIVIGINILLSLYGSIIVPKLIKLILPILN
ncbi:MAG TPA: stage II sporulation protein M [Bacilli bacterium]|nr:stage II sporulation protein M [Bacilli bacterium]